MKEESARKLVRFFSIFSIFASLWLFLSSIAFISTIRPYIYNQILVISQLVLVVPCLVGGIGLWKFKKWARIFVLISAFLLMLAWMSLPIINIIQLNSNTSDDTFIEVNARSDFIDVMLGILYILINPIIIVCVLYIYFFMFNKSVKELFKKSETIREINKK